MIETITEFKYSKMAGVFHNCFGRKGKEPSAFIKCRDLTLNNSEDRLFVTDRDNHSIQIFTTDGQFLTEIGNWTGAPFTLHNPTGILYTQDGHILVASNKTHSVLVFKEDRRFISAIEGTYQGKERFRYPNGVIMMDNGHIVIACGSKYHSYQRVIVF